MRVHALLEVETRLVLNGTSWIPQRLRHLQQDELGDWNWKQSAARFTLAGALFLLATLCEFSKASPAAPAQDGGKRETNVSSDKSTSTASPSHIIKIKALIDGADTIKIQGNKVWYEHESWDLPGKWQGRDENTLINDKSWHPEWLGEASNSRSSDPYLSLRPAFSPKTPANIKLTKIAGRGEVEISQLPTPENHQTLSIHLDDSSLQYQGADWYEVTIEWNKGTVTNVLKIKALIDGADTLKIQGNKVWYEHESWDLPGKWQGRDENTLINDMPWHPTWHFFMITASHTRSCGPLLRRNRGRTSS